MDPVVEGNHGKNSKEGYQEFCVNRAWRNLIIVDILGESKLRGFLFCRHSWLHTPIKYVRFGDYKRKLSI